MELYNYTTVRIVVVASNSHTCSSKELNWLIKSKSWKANTFGVHLNIDKEKHWVYKCRQQWIKLRCLCETTWHPTSSKFSSVHKLKHYIRSKIMKVLAVQVWHHAFCILHNLFPVIFCMIQRIFCCHYMWCALYIMRLDDERMHQWIANISILIALL